MIGGFIYVSGLYAGSAADTPSRGRSGRCREAGFRFPAPAPPLAVRDISTMTIDELKRAGELTEEI
jgi:hypothetical protein